MSLNLRPWQWLVLLALLMSNLGLAALALPMVMGNAGDAAAAVVYPGEQEDSALFPTQTPLWGQATQAIQPALAPPSPTATPRAASDFPAPTRPAAPTPTLRPPPALPAEAHLADIRGHAQTYALSCEARSAADWAGYFGVAIDESEFLYRLPVSDNPDFGFVGDVHGPWGLIPPDSYGVHAGPVAALLRGYGLNAYAHRGLAWDDVRAQIAAGQPVIAWVVGHVEPGASETYITDNGVMVTVARYEHTVIVTGYTQDSVIVLDGARHYSRPLEVFLASWGVLGNMVIVRGLLPALP